MCEAAEGGNGYPQNRLVNASRLTPLDFPLGHHWSWDCPMSTGSQKGVQATEDLGRLALLG